MSRKFFILIIFGLMILPSAHCQFKNSIWCFGDSAGINFSNINNPVITAIGMRSMGSAVSITDMDDSLLFYANTRTTLPGKTTLVYNRYNQPMPNGNNIIGRGWYHELVIVPNPADTNLFYLFSAGVTSIYGLYYSTVYLTLDSGKGDIVQKNIQLNTLPITDCIATIKHGNGRDWWFFFRDYDPNSMNLTNTFYSYLITPQGITNYNVQSIGTLRGSSLSSFVFNKQGNKLCVTDAGGLIELYDFDRCSGLLSNPVNIRLPVPPFPYYIGCAFSPNSNILYVSAEPYESYLFQYDLTAPNIAATKDTLWTTTFPLYTAGHLKLAPDDKIYFSCIYYNGSQFPYPYKDSVYNMYNMNLSVINSPDSLGAACNFQPYSFYLGGKRTYYGLPNNPDYEMKPLYGSVCDSLSAGIESLPTPKTGEMFVTYVSEWEKLFINAQHIKGATYTLTVTDIMGRQVFKQKGGLRPPYFTKDLDCTSFAKGMYLVTLTTNKEQLSQKFVKE